MPELPGPVLGEDEDRRTGGGKEDAPEKIDENDRSEDDGQLTSTLWRLGTRRGPCPDA